MKSVKVVMLLSVLFLQGRVGVADQKVTALEEENKVSAEDWEIIRDLEFLEHVDFLLEDIEFLEEYGDVEQSESIGESDD
jgi:hypothetical protein